MKYKLIKTYPGSPELGAIVENKSGCIYFLETKTTWSSTDSNYFKNIVEEQPEFWEKVEEKEWEILGFTDGINNYFKISNGNFTINLQYEYTEEDLLVKSKNTITKIRRLSDGVIFKIGDKVTNPNSKSQTFVIEKFYLDCEGRHMLAGPGHIGIHKIEHCKEPVFVTEDGISIFDVNTPTYFVDCNYIIGRQSIGYIFHNYLKYFSTKEKAEEYIDLNKLKFSKKEIKDILDLESDFWSDGEIIDKIYELIKSK